MSVSPDTDARKVSVRQKAALAVKRRAVAVETLCEGQHDVRVLVDFASDVAEGDLTEGERDNALPRLEGLSYGFKRGSFPHFGGEVLYTAVRWEGGRI